MRDLPLPQPAAAAWVTVALVGDETVGAGAWSPATSQRCVDCLAQRVAEAVGRQPGDMAWIFEYADAIHFTRTSAGEERLEITHYSDESKNRLMLMEAMRDV